MSSLRACPTGGPSVDCLAMPAPALPPLRYLSASDVVAAMPPVETRLALAELTMTALVSGAELPPKIGVHPRPPDSFAHAMPAFLRDDQSGIAGPGDTTPGGALRAGDGGLSVRADALGMKWVAGFPTNGERGIPAIHAIVLLNDPDTGVPIAILDGAPITAQRTAAVSGIAVRRFARRVSGRSPRVVLIGAGTQGESHAMMLGHVLPGAELVIHDRDLDRAKALAARARTMTGIARVDVAASAREATPTADIVITAASFGPVRQVMTNDWLAPDALVVPIDYATYCSAEVARDAALFLVDERSQFEANRAAGDFEGYPDPHGTIGEAILEDLAPPAHGRIVVTHLGVGLADLVFGRAILASAVRLGLGIVLPR